MESPLPASLSAEMSRRRGDEALGTKSCGWRALLREFAMFVTNPTIIGSMKGNPKRVIRGVKYRLSLRQPALDLTDIYIWHTDAFLREGPHGEFCTIVLCS